MKMDEMRSIAEGSRDAITSEVVRHKLESIANEMETTLLRSSFSPVVKEALDTSASLFTIEGETLAQACAVPIHLAALIPMVRTLLDRHPRDKMKEGDIYILNDPYQGGTHLPDVALMMPVFYEDRPFAVTAAITHHQDLGGLTPGSLPPNATEIFSEGVRIPLLKFWEAGQPNETLLAMLRQNVRVPKMFVGDLNGQVAACRVGAKRLIELVDKYGHNRLIGIFDDLLTRAEMMTREALRGIPNGTYQYTDCVDNDGVDLGETIKISVDVIIRDDTLHVDLSDVSRQVRGPVNCTPSGAFAAAYFAIRVIAGDLIPTNGGCFRVVSMTLPKGTIVNPIEPAPVNARMSTVQRISGCILGALAEVLPDRISASSSGPSHALMFGGYQQDGSAFVTGDFAGGGSGASCRSDGVDVIESETCNGMNVPSEAIEIESPIRINRMELRNGSGGCGEFRGGLGLRREYECLVDGVTFTHRGERHMCPARGLKGGGDGLSARTIVIRTDGRVEEILSKGVVTLNNGDRVLVETGGGGGYGDPKKRSRERVTEDLENGKVSKLTASLT